MVCVGDCEISMQELGSPKVSSDSRSDLALSASGAANLNAGPSVHIGHVYVQRWCTYYELSVNLGPSWWWQENSVNSGADAVDANTRSHCSCGWTVHRRYRHFREFDKILRKAISSMSTTSGGQVSPDENGLEAVLAKLPALPRRQSKLLVNHSSENFVQDRLQGLQSYLQGIVSLQRIQTVLSSPKLVQWLTDFPRPYYPATDRPTVFLGWDILSAEAVTPWGSASVETRFDSSPTSSEWIHNAHTSDDVSMNGPCVHNQIPVNNLLNSKLALFCGRIWQLKLDAIAVDAPEDYYPLYGTTYWDVLRVAGRKRTVNKAVALLDDCQIGQVGILPGGNLPAKHLLLTSAPFYKLKYAYAAYSSLHVCYRKVLEAAVDNGFRTIAIDCMHGRNKGFPRGIACHIALQTIRAFLEGAGGHYFDLIVLVSSELCDHDELERAAPQHFPRRSSEAGGAGLLARVGDEDSESSSDSERPAASPWSGPAWRAVVGDDGDVHDSDRDCRIGVSPVSG